MTRELTYAQAIREATEQEMERDPAVFVLGMGVDDPKGIFGTTLGLVEKFGPQRVFDTPLAEDGMCGVAIGAAFAGLRPIHVHIRMDFLLLATNQLVNIAAKARYMWGGNVSVPLVVRAVVGRSWGQGAQHSQSLQSLYMHLPGLRVIAPSTPYDAKGTLLWAIRDPNPVVFIEHRLLHAYQKGPVPEEDYVCPPRARVLHEGDEITIVGISYMVVEAQRAASLLESAGVSAEVIDPVYLSPLDEETILRSVKKTGRLLVVDNAWTSCGASAEILARVIERSGNEKPPAVRRMGFAPVPCPTTRPLENLFYPNPHGIARTALEMVRPGSEIRLAEADPPIEAVAFKGPF